MLAAFLTTIFFAFSAIFANRSLRAVGATRANLGRLLFAALCLGAYAHLLGGGLRGAGRDWLLLSGVVGMGLGDLALFMALPLLGSRLTVLMTQCLAAPIAMLAERLWLGTQLGHAQLFWSFVILTGVAIALLPSRANPPRVQIKPVGFLFGLLAACGQGLGAVVSRKANTLTALAGEPIDGITAAYQRILGGLAITLVWFAVRAAFARKSAPASGIPAIAPPLAPGLIPATLFPSGILPTALPKSGITPATPLVRRVVPAIPPPPAEARQVPAAPLAISPTARAHLWIPLNALCGAVIGVSCYQWALATTPSGIVLPIVACTPLVIVPLSYWFDGEHPTRRSLLGGLIAVAGSIALTR